VFVGRLAEVAVGAGTVGAGTVDGEIVDVGRIVAPGEGPFVEAGPAQLLSSTKNTTRTIIDRIGLSSAKKYFIEEISWLHALVSPPCSLLWKAQTP